MKRICKICGCEFAPETPNTWLCSAECREQNRYNHGHRRTREYAEEQYDASRRRNDSIRAIALKAEAAGMSYGKYIARRKG